MLGCGRSTITIIRPDITAACVLIHTILDDRTMSLFERQWREHGSSIAAEKIFPPCSEVGAWVHFGGAVGLWGPLRRASPLAERFLVEADSGLAIVTIRLNVHTIPSAFLWRRGDICGMR